MEQGTFHKRVGPLEGSKLFHKMGCSVAGIMDGLLHRMVHSVVSTMAGLSTQSQGLGRVCVLTSLRLSRLAPHNFTDKDMTLKIITHCDCSNHKFSIYTQDSSPNPIK